MTWGLNGTIPEFLNPDPAFSGSLLSNMPLSTVLPGLSFNATARVVTYPPLARIVKISFQWLNKAAIKWLGLVGHVGR